MRTPVSLSIRFLRRAQKGMSKFQQRVNQTGPGIDAGRSRALKADYNKSTLEVYRDLARFLMRKSPRVLDVLSHAHHTDDPVTESWPSWVPKWFQPRSASLIGCFGCFPQDFAMVIFPISKSFMTVPSLGSPRGLTFSRSMAIS